MTALSRRRFLARAGRFAGVLAAAPSLQGLVACAERAGTGTSGADSLRAAPGEGGYGPLVEAGPELALPEGFRYRVFGREGEVMSDGTPTPRAHDGMAAFPRPGGGVILVRNHEDRSDPSGAELLGDPGLAYDPAAGGGTTTLEVTFGPDGEPELVGDRVSLGGTIYNCAGGATPWGTWLSCEEATQGRGRGWERPHGYVFEVPAATSGQARAEPLDALGRFDHEAAAVDPETWVVYLTEDEPRAGLYRFLPAERGRLAAGGRLEMLKVEDEPGADLASGRRTGEVHPIEWVEIGEPDPPDAEENPAAVFEQGRGRGAARFSRLEGCWWGDGGVYFHATNGGDAGLGQVWHYRPARGGGSTAGELRLVFESPKRSVLDSPDNITVSPRGGVLMCEDGDGTNHLRGLTPGGKVFEFARNVLNGREFAGATFSPDGRVLFVNIQGDLEPGGPGQPGMTLAVWGPWERGAL